MEKFMRQPEDLQRNDKMIKRYDKFCEEVKDITTTLCLTCLNIVWICLNMSEWVQTGPKPSENFEKLVKISKENQKFANFLKEKHNFTNVCQFLRNFLGLSPKT